jgi:DNA-binding HxlR family transcriptional regulator
MEARVHASRTKGYGQYCPVARTLDLLGDRWTLLIVRELLDGEVRFGDLVTRLRGIPRNLLVDRLRTLEAAGLLSRRTFREIPPRVEYALTEKGRTLEPVLEAIARWGYEHLLGEPEPGEVDLDWLFGRLPRQCQARGEAGVVAVEIRDSPEGTAGARFLEFDGAGCSVAEVATQPPRARLATDLRTWLGLMSGRLDPAQALRAGLITAEGDLELVQRLPELFGCRHGL